MHANIPIHLLYISGLSFAIALLGERMAAAYALFQSVAKRQFRTLANVNDSFQSLSASLSSLTLAAANML